MPRSRACQVAGGSGQNHPPMLRWFRFFSRWPLWALHLLGSAGGWLAWCFSGRYRSRFLHNARQAGLGWGGVWRAVGQAGRMSAELPRLWLGRTPPVVWADDRSAPRPTPPVPKVATSSRPWPKCRPATRLLCHVVTRAAPMRRSCVSGKWPTDSRTKAAATRNAAAAWGRR